MTQRLLDLAGHDGSALPCVLWDGEGPGVAVVFPGGARAGNRLGGTPARPDLHYTRALLLDLGLSVLEVWWDAEGAPELAGAVPWLDANADAALAAARDAGELRCLVGRSFGTCALARLVTRPELAELPTVWIAPLLQVEGVRAGLERAASAAIVLAGTADPAFDAAAAESARRRGATLVLVEGGDHALDVGDAAASARALADAVAELGASLGRRL